MRYLKCQVRKETANHQFIKIQEEGPPPAEEVMAVTPPRINVANRVKRCVNHQSRLGDPHTPLNSKKKEIHKIILNTTTTKATHALPHSITSLSIRLKAARKVIRQSVKTTNEV